MCSPLKVDEAIYVETYYDAETVMRILTIWILDAVEYDYIDIQIVVLKVLIFMAFDDYWEMES